MRIPAEIADTAIGKGDDGKYAAFASDLGLKPGDWPREILLPDGSRFVKRNSVVTDGELKGFEYATLGEFRLLTVFND